MHTFVLLLSSVAEASLRTGDASCLDFAGAMTLAVQVILMGQNAKCIHFRWLYIF